MRLEMPLILILVGLAAVGALLDLPLQVFFDLPNWVHALVTALPFLLVTVLIIDHEFSGRAKGYDPRRHKKKIH